MDPPFVSFQRRVWSADGDVSWQHDTMSEGDFVDVKKVASGGYLHLLQAPFDAAAAIEHRPDVPFWSGIAAGAAQAQYWSLHSRPQQGGRWESVRCINDASCTK